MNVEASPEGCRRTFLPKELREAIMFACHSEASAAQPKACPETPLNEGNPDLLAFVSSSASLSFRSQFCGARNPVLWFRKGPSGTGLQTCDLSPLLRLL